MTYPNCQHCGNKLNHPKDQRKRGAVSNRTICRSCSVSRRRWKSKLELVEHLGGKCKECGYAGHPAALNFHHRDPSTKSFELSANGLLLAARWDEVKKCDLLCANCHSIRHTNTILIKSLLGAIF